MSWLATGAIRSVRHMRLLWNLAGKMSDQQNHGSKVHGTMVIWPANSIIVRQITSGSISSNHYLVPFPIASQWGQYESSLVSLVVMSRIGRNGGFFPWFDLCWPKEITVQVASRGHLGPCSSRSVINLPLSFTRKDDSFNFWAISERWT